MANERPHIMESGGVKDAKKSVVALGMFDGVHIGHRRLLEEASALARREGLTLIVHTFYNHPLSVLQKAPKLLSSPEEKIELLYALGADRVVADTFTPELAATMPESFVRGLFERFDMAYAVAGFNYTFGSGGKGDARLLKALGAKLGFESLEIPPFLEGLAPVSSSRIRTLLSCGAVREANAMLGRAYALKGTVVRNRRIGSSIGFPTANLGGIENMALPSAGVYATRALVNGTLYGAVTSVGKNPTVEGKETTVETHILDFKGDIYEKPLTVFFVELLREEMRFKSLDGLAAQIARDAQNARAVL